MELDDSVVHLKAGDVLVQRGTIHNWINRGSAPCVIAFILIDAKPVEINGKVLHAGGDSLSRRLSRPDALGGLRVGKHDTGISLQSGKITRSKFFASFCRDQQKNRIGHQSIQTRVR